MTDPTDLLSIEARQAEREKYQEIKASRKAEVLSWVLSDQRGRAFVWSLLERAGTFRQPFTGNREHTDFQCGRKDIGLQLLADVMGEAPEVFARMMKENEDYERSLADL